MRIFALEGEILNIVVLHPSTQGNNRSLPVTARSLETLIRLASAHAKARLSQRVEETDAAKAMELMSFALYHESASLDEASHDKEGPNKRGSTLDRRTGVEGDTKAAMHVSELYSARDRTRTCWLLAAWKLFLLLMGIILLRPLAYITSGHV